MSENKLLIAAAGSGKTTYLVKEATKITETRALITTYTEANELEIRKKLRVIPSNITTQTWFSFLLEHGVRPYQSFILDKKIKGMLLVNEASGIKYTNKQGFHVGYKEDSEAEKHYLSADDRIFSDKISKFICACNKKSNGAVLNRLRQIYTHIFIDEVQDLAGYDLELIKLMMREGIKVYLVGDPRQVTYLTHHPKKHPKYKDGKIKDFIVNELPKIISCTIDEDTLSVSHRNNQDICDLASKLYPDLAASSPCECIDCVASRHVSNKGIYLVHPDHVENYVSDNNTVIQLRWDKRSMTSPSITSYNFGNSKGLGFDHVLIYPTQDMHGWLFDNGVDLSSETRAKLYVAITRARHSVAFVSDISSNEYEIYKPQEFVSFAS